MVYLCRSDMSREKEIYKVTLVGSAGNVALLTFKFIAGVMGHSSAMIADAVHSLSDFITDIIVLAFVHVSAKTQDVGHDYGHGKYETFASFIIGLALLAAATGIIVSGIAKFIDWAGGTDLAAPGWLAFAAAIISILVKEGLYRYTHRPLLPMPGIIAVTRFPRLGLRWASAAPFYWATDGRCLTRWHQWQ